MYQFCSFLITAELCKGISCAPASNGRMETGGQTKLIIVFRNGEQEFRKRAKLRAGDVIEVEEYKVRIE